jgi:hypothetical protein
MYLSHLKRDVVEKEAPNSACGAEFKWRLAEL